MSRAVRVALCCGLLVFALAPAARAAQVDGDTVIVQYAPGASPSARAAAGRAAAIGARVGSISGLGAQVVHVDGDPTTAAARLNRSSAVLYAEPNVILSATAIPNDPRFRDLWGLNNTGQAGGRPDADIDAPEGWDEGGIGGFPSGGGATVGIVDTGIDQTHPDLQGRTVVCAGVSQLSSTVSTANGCTDDNNHGTHVSGTIAAIANNGIGVAGVAFDARLAHCKALFGSLGQGSTAGVANCITYLASHGARVISMSLGGGPSTTMRNAVRRAYNNANGSLLVAAAGNDGNSTLEYPAAYPEVVSVAATDRTDARASFSNANSDVEVAAPGVAIVSTVRGGGYASFSGTSMATPHASGVAAEIWSRNPSLTAAQVRGRLDAAVDDLGPAGRDTSFGFGRVNLQKALP
jgi:subtilisin family serine protease